VLHADLLGERARITPDAEALVEVATGRRFTYRELDLRATRTARALRHGLGLAPGDRVALLAGNRVEFLDLYFACARCGAVLVPVNVRLAVPEIEAVLAHSGARAVVYAGEHREAVARLERAGCVERWVALDGPAAPGHTRLEELTAAAPGGAWTGPRPGPEDLLALLYTSGTTGRPKGVMIPHRMVAFDALATVIGWQLGADDTSPIFTPLYHAGGLGAFLGPIVAIGGRIVLHRGFDPGEVWRTVERERCTVILGVPTIWRALLEAPELARTDTSSVRWLISGGAPLPVSLIAAYRERGLVLRQGYGLTEVGVNCFAMTDRDAWERAGSVGRPLPYTVARLVDGAGRDVPPGETGELLLAGPHVSAGYWNDPEATAAAYDPAGFFHTGDLARRDEDGFFYIVGRKKEMFISGGVNVFPAEIEAVLAEQPDLEDAAVVGVPDERWGEAGVAFVVPRPGREVSPEALAAWLAQVRQFEA